MTLEQEIQAIKRRMVYRGANAGYLETAIATLRLMIAELGRQLELFRDETIQEDIRQRKARYKLELAAHHFVLLSTGELDMKD